MKHFVKGLLYASALACCMLPAATYGEQASVFILPKSISIVEEEAFYGAAAIEEVSLPSGTLEIGARAFAYSSISRINLPSSLTTIAADAFEGCDGLIAVVDESSYAHNWCLENGVNYELSHTHSFEEGSCTCVGCGETFDIQIALDVEMLKLAVGESVTLRPELTAGFEGFDRSITYDSSNPSVVEVAQDGFITAVAAGEAVVTVRTSNGISADCSVQVSTETVAPSFAWETATMIAGDTAKLEIYPNKAAYENGYSIVSSMPDLLQVDQEKQSITAAANQYGDVTLELWVNGDETGAAASSPITILAESALEFSVSELTVKTFKDENPLPAQGELVLSGLPMDLIGTYSLVIEDESLISYIPELGLVQGKETAGTTRIVCKTFDREVICSVTVEYLPTYRAVIIGEYNNSSETGSNLPFAANNLNAMRTTLQASDALGQGYETIGFYPNNPSQSQIQAAIANTFAEAKEGDVSLVYIVSHGYNNRADINNGGYFFGTPNWSSTKPNTIITSVELLNWLKPIEGNVVLVLDSCKSGGFLYDFEDEVAAEENIAVITAQTHDKNAAFFNGSSALRKVEFLTYVFCYGLGYDYSPDDTNYAYFRNAMVADTNGDNLVTIQEIFDYTKRRVPTLVKEKADQYYTAGSKSGFVVPGVDNKTELKAWGGQNPQIYIPDALADTVLYGWAE